PGGAVDPAGERGPQVRRPRHHAGLSLLDVVRRLRLALPWCRPQASDALLSAERRDCMIVALPCPAATRQRAVGADDATGWRLRQEHDHGEMLLPRQPGRAGPSRGGRFADGTGRDFAARWRPNPPSLENPGCHPGRAGLPRESPSTSAGTARANGRWMAITGSTPMLPTCAR